MASGAQGRFGMAGILVHAPPSDNRLSLGYSTIRIEPVAGVSLADKTVRLFRAVEIKVEP